jgi:methylmalonyl-CoA mutase cobalamin-binding subunit
MKPQVTTDTGARGAVGKDGRGPAIRFLVESALRKIASDYVERSPQGREEWVERLCAALMSDAESSHRTVLASLIATGVSSEEIYLDYVPAAAKRLGEMWISDTASFVDVTLGASRLQALFRKAGDARGLPMLDRSIPLGQEILMVIPPFEQHSLGAFVAADTFRRHGVWVRMAIGLEEAELVELLRAGRFSALGLTLATRKSVDQAGELIEYLRMNVRSLPPIVVGGRIVGERGAGVRRCGADHAVMSVREAIERCGLATVTERLTVREGSRD